MSLSAEEIADVVAELQPLVGGTVQKIYAPTPRTAILELRVPGATHQLLLSAEPDETRIHLATSRPPSPPAPLPLQNLLRAHALPSRIAAIEQVPGERIVRIRLEGPNGVRTLVAELTGRHGNLILLDGQGRVLGLAVPSPSTTRAILPGHTWEPPPPPSGVRPERARRRFAADPALGPFPISRAIEAVYAPKSRERLLAERRRDAARGIAAARKRIESALGKLEDEASRAAKAEDLRRYGDLLKTVVNRVPRGASSVRVTEYTADGVEEVLVPLRPELSAKANLDRYYKEYRRMRTAQERIAERRAQLLEQRARLQDLAVQLNAADNEALIDELARQAASLGARPKKQGQKARDLPRPPYRAFVSATGRPIWVGRGSKENDQLTFKVARGNDLWVHVRGLPGAHVVVPLARGAEPDAETLLDACALAVHYSGARGEAVAEVAHTQARHVRKPKGSAPGAVLYVQEKVVPYRHDPARIERLLAQQAD
mgnify:CR=1 FL=1